MATSAADLYEQLKTIHRQLEQLGEAGRIVRMEADKHNDHPDAAHALMTALESIETAINATAWMRTEPDSNGEYPELKE